MTNPETLPFPGFDTTTVNCVHLARDIQIAIDGREEAICFKCKSRESYLCSGNRIASNENETQNLLINTKKHYYHFWIYKPTFIVCYMSYHYPNALCIWVTMDACIANGYQEYSLYTVKM